MSINELSVLLIEPSKPQRKFIESKLKEAGCKFVEVVDEPDAGMAKMDSFVPDLVISCMYFKGMDSFDLLSRMRETERLKEVPFMLISSENRFESLEPIRQAGVMAVLPKPFDVSDMKMALQATAEFIDPDELETEWMDVEELRVLVVDDSKTARTHVSKLLSKMGMKCITLAEDGLRAIEKLEESEFDLVITDFNMPEMDGERLTSYIRNSSAQASIPVLMITSEQDNARLGSVMKSGVSAICDKPFSSSHVRSLLNQLLG
ncbi:MAG: response regulator [Pseudomonadales bacterium]|nr:response regulator [Pseudomonadales bacterium]